MKVAVIRTGTANLASVLAGLKRAGAEPYITDSPGDVRSEGRVLLPGVGSYEAAMAELRAKGLDAALADRFRSGAPLAGFCLGMQLFFDSSEESPGVKGLGLLPGAFLKYPDTVRTPRLGWGLVQPEPESPCLEPGWAAFANSYRLLRTTPVPSWRPANARGSSCASSIPSSPEAGGSPSWGDGFRNPPRRDRPQALWLKPLPAPRRGPSRAPGPCASSPAWTWTRGAW